MRNSLLVGILLGCVFGALITGYNVWPFLKETKFDEYDRLERVIAEFRLGPIQVRQFAVDDKYLLGRALFFDPILSGPRSVACVTCHLFDHGTSDGLDKSVGAGGEGLGPQRALRNRKSEHRHNSLDLLNRDSREVRSLFWDGRVEMLDPGERIFRSPLESKLPAGFDNTMAVQAVFPLITPDEMLGYEGGISESNLPAEHADQPNELAIGMEHKTFPERYNVVERRLVRRLLGSIKPKEWQRKYRRLFESAYPGVSEFSLVHIANAISHYEELAFATDSSRWDRYLADRSEPLSIGAVKGAVVFYGKGRCAVCHSGPLFSDFNFHSVGIFGSHLVEISRQLDSGRAYATGAVNDMYKFRTPPLRNVTKTAPYFHDGSSETLSDAISRHVNPWIHADAYADDGGAMLPVEQARAISPMFSDGPELDGHDISYLIQFLTVLEFEPRENPSIVPPNVPSGLPLVYKAN